MELKDIYIVATLTAVMGLVAAVLMYIMSRMKNDRYDLELKKMQLDVMRHSLELKSYEANDSLMSDPARWNSINHLLIEAIKGQSSKAIAQIEANPSTAFFESLGAKVSNKLPIKTRVFVLTPFHPKYEASYRAIKEACSRLNLECKRGDEEFKPGAVLAHIIEEMNSASIIIANIDGRNPNVYYELGIAHAIGKKTILVASDIEQVPFDLKQQRIVLYKTHAELIESLTTFLGRSFVDA